MDAFLLLALFGLLVLLTAVVFAVTRALRVLRDAGAFGDALAPALQRIASGVDHIAARAEATEASRRRLERAVARLARSRARLGVLGDAYADATRTLVSLVFVSRR